MCGVQKFSSIRLWKTWLRNTSRLEFDVCLKPNVLQADISEARVKIRACDNSMSTSLTVSLADVVQDDTVI